MYGTTVAELSILHSALSEIVSLVLLSVAFFFHSSPTTESLEKVSYVFVDFIYNHTHQADNRRVSFSFAYTTVWLFEQRNNH